MRYYILTTTKFADECIKYKVYGSTSSNWLANIELGDIVFISQFSYKSQDIYGPFKVCKTLFYDKKIIYPDQRYHYRIKIKPINLKVIEETDLYLQGIKNKNFNLAIRIISLIQQNKHLHSISLTENEGRFMLKTFTDYEKTTKIYSDPKNYLPAPDASKVNLTFLENKNRLFKKYSFSSESDLESYILLSLKDKNSNIFKNLSEILNHFPNNNLASSIIYNQFIFGNAYPSDIVIINSANINVFELKKNQFDKSSLEMIKKELKKYCYYSLYSPRLLNERTKQRVNFFIVFPRNESYNFEKILKKEFELIINSINKFRENNFVILEYYITDNKLIFDTLQNIKN